MEQKLQELKNHLAEIYDLEMVGLLLGWDQSTYMPVGGAVARARQTALISKLAHQRATDPEIGRLLDALQPWADSLPYDSDDASLVRIARQDYERQTRVPAEFMGRLFQHASETYEAWVKAREENDFPGIQPALEKTLDLSRQFADYYPGLDDGGRRREVVADGVAVDRLRGGLLEMGPKVGRPARLLRPAVRSGELRQELVGLRARHAVDL